MNYVKRLDALRQQLRIHDWKGYAVISVEHSDGANLRYLTGFEGSFGALIVTAGEAVFCTDSRYLARAKGQLKGVEVRPIKRVQEVAQLVQTLKLKQVALNAQRINLELYRELGQLLPGVELTAASDCVATLRQCKEPAEIDCIRKAQQMTDEAFGYIRSCLKPGLTEAKVAWEMELFIRRNEGYDLAFPIMVASGPHSALPHHATGSRSLQTGEFVLFDFGAQWGGYRADMTRTVFLGQPTPKHKEIYQTVLQAQQASLKAIRAGASGKAADGAGRKIIQDAGYGDHFGHGTGHGVGLEIHEEPRMTFLRDSVLPEHAVVTVEPGIYLEGWGGVRIEDLVVVTKAGVDNLTRSAKELISL